MLFDQQKCKMKCSFGMILVSITIERNRDNRRREAQNRYKARVLCVQILRDKCSQKGSTVQVQGPCAVRPIPQRHMFV